MEINEGDKIAISKYKDSDIPIHRELFEVKKVSGNDLLVKSLRGMEYCISRSWIDNKVEELEWEIEKWDDQDE